MKHLAKKFVTKFFQKFIRYSVSLQNLMNKRGRKILLLVLCQLRGSRRPKIVFRVGENLRGDSKIKFLALFLNLAKMQQISMKIFPIISIPLIKILRHPLIRNLKIQGLLLLYLLVLNIINPNFRTDFKTLRVKQLINKI